MVRGYGPVVIVCSVAWTAALCTSSAPAAANLDSPAEARAVLSDLAPGRDQAARDAALDGVHAYLKDLRSRVERGGTLTPAEASLMSHAELLAWMVALAHEPDFARTAEQCLSLIQEPALDYLETQPASRRIDALRRSIERAIARRKGYRSASTWYSAYGTAPEEAAASPAAAATGAQPATQPAAAPAAPAMEETPPLLAPLQTNRRLAVEAGLGFLSGSTTYEIGGHVAYADGRSTDLHFPISRLEFPLDVIMLQARGQYVLNNRWTAHLGLSGSLSSDAGTMEDSDWLAPGMLTVFSESDTELDAFTLNASARRLLHQGQRVRWSAEAGILYQDYGFTISNTDQWYPIAPYLPHSYVPGVGLTYDITMTMPYARVLLDYALSPNWTVTGGLGFSPLATAEDEDAHLVRDPQKFSTGEYDGDGMLYLLRSRYQYGERWFFSAEFSGVSMDLDGDQDVQSGSDRWTIDATSELSQSRLKLLVGRTF